MAKNYGYQYETSPRKIEPEYKRPKQNQKNTNFKKKQIKSNRKKNKSNKKLKISFEFKFFVNSMLIFGIVFAIIACEALVKQRYKEKESLKKEYNELLASSHLVGELNENVKNVANEYGMQTKSATLISLDATDYIEGGDVQIEKPKVGFFQKILNWFKGM